MKKVGTMTLRKRISELSERARAFSVESLINAKEHEELMVRDEVSHGKSSFGKKFKGKCIASSTSISMELCSSDLWSKFSEIGTEMIVTKAGRRMFPTLKVRFHGLSMSTTYIVYMDIIPVGETRYRYIYHSSQWMAAGTSSEVCSENNLYVHPDSPATGQLWTSQGHISFDKVKLTNNKRPIMAGQISLHSMHKYQPRIHILEVPIGDSLRLNSTTEMADYIRDNKDKVETFSFEETVFITVTAYQNQEITRLKIESNPFAKGFRETTKPREDRIYRVPTNQEPGRESSSDGNIQHFQMYPNVSWKTEPPQVSQWWKKAQKIPLKFVIPPSDLRRIGMSEETGVGDDFYRNYR